jgi:hypothetical protein
VQCLPLVTAPVRSTAGPSASTATPARSGFADAVKRVQALSAGAREATPTRRATPAGVAATERSAAGGGVEMESSFVAPLFDAASRGSVGDRPSPVATRGAALDRAALACETIALRDRSSLELRFERGVAVRMERVADGVTISVDAGRAAQPLLDPGALADAVRARGVTVVRAVAHHATAQRRGGSRSGAR